MTSARLVFSCPVCSAVGPARSLSVVGSSVQIVCDCCGAATRISSYGADDDPSQAEIDFGADTERGGQPPATPTASAGADPLLKDKLAVVDGVATLPPELAQRYRDIVRAGDRLEQHRKLVQSASVTDQLEPLGVIYRFRLERLPADPIASEMRELVMQQALARLATSRSAGRDVSTAHRVGQMAAVLFALLSAAALVYIGLRACASQPLDEAGLETPVE
ncbi:MAG: hypothetical protein JXR83_23495 [Deltaproteobacteria bacterium]|nr:hypothetical protein [Deltaproteobacteria bacterium]